MSKINEIGEVIELHGRKARVKILRGDGCESCEMHDSCLLKSRKELTMSVQNSVDADVGDTVEIEIGGMEYLGGVAVVFILPTIFLLLFYFIGNHLFSEAFGVLFAFVGLFAGMVVAWIIGKGRWGERFGYKIKRILGDSERVVD